MVKLKLVFLVLVVGLFLSGCAMLNRGIFDPIPQFPSPYQSSFKFETNGKKDVEYEILGEGYGEASGIAVGPFGLFYFQQPDAMKAYERAANSKGGDILLESRTQFTTTSILSPIIFSRGTIKVWGISARLKK